jgi:hypothetical protein
MPRPGGAEGGILLAPPAIELICNHGHGMLTTSQRVRQLYPREHWAFAGDWWRDLARSASR